MGGGAARHDMAMSRNALINQIIGPQLAISRSDRRPRTVFDVPDDATRDVYSNLFGRWWMFLVFCSTVKPEFAVHRHTAGIDATFQRVRLVAQVYVS